MVSYYCVLAVLLVHKKSKEAVTTSLAPPASRCCIVSRTLAILCARVAQSSVYVLMYTATRSIATHYDRPFYPLGAIVGLSSAVHLLFLIRPLLGRIAWAEAYLHSTVCPVTDATKSKCVPARAAFWAYQAGFLSAGPGFRLDLLNFDKNWLLHLIQSSSSGLLYLADETACIYKFCNTLHIACHVTDYNQCITKRRLNNYCGVYLLNTNICP